MCRSLVYQTIDKNLMEKDMAMLYVMFIGVEKNKMSHVCFNTALFSMLNGRANNIRNTFVLFYIFNFPSFLSNSNTVRNAKNKPPTLALFYHLAPYHFPFIQQSGKEDLFLPRSPTHLSVVAF